MSFTDKTLTCRDCGNQFVFTVGEQEFYAQKGFTNEPARCPTCRQVRKAAGGGSRSRSYGDRQGGYGERQSFEVTCADCGRKTTVPFQPTQGRPVYCSDCFQSQRSPMRYR
ncbi:MAG: zinc-binding protein [Herpetosiphonaceae bacterium]|nr:MAG: zinc-binding protein [Herpetosiphonaceae bacterium]